MMIRSPAIALLVLAPMLALCPGTARADRDEAMRFFHNGAVAYKEGQFDVAAIAFDQAYAQVALPEIAYSAAQAHRLQFQSDHAPAQLARAIELYQSYLAMDTKGVKRKEAEGHLDRLTAMRAQLAPAEMKIVVAPEVPQLYVSVPVATALVTIDDHAVEQNTPVDVTSGRHQVTVTAEGFLPQTRTVSVGSTRAMIAIDLQPRPAMLAVHTQRDARVTIDGRPAVFRGGVAEVPSGRRLITVSARGRTPVSRDLELAPGQVLTFDAPLAATAQRRAVRWVWTASGILAVGAVVTGGLALHADLHAASLRDGPPLDDSGTRDYTDARSTRDRDRSIALVLGGVALAGVGTGLAMYFLDHPAADAGLRPMEQAPASGGLQPMAFGDHLGEGFGLGYHGAF